METLLAFAAGLAVGLVLGAVSVSHPARRRRRGGPQRAEALRTPPTGPPPVEQTADDQRLTDLRQNLLLKVGGDSRTVVNLLSFERAQRPEAPLVRLYEYAVDRWEIENRSRY